MCCPARSTPAWCWIRNFRSRTWPRDTDRCTSVAPSRRCCARDRALTSIVQRGHVCATRLRGALTPDRRRAQSWAVKGAFVVRQLHELIGEWKNAWWLEQDLRGDGCRGSSRGQCLRE